MSFDREVGNKWEDSEWEARLNDMEVPIVLLPLRLWVMFPCERGTQDGAQSLKREGGDARVEGEVRDRAEFRKSYRVGERLGIGSDPIWSC